MPARGGIHEPFKSSRCCQPDLSVESTTGAVAVPARARIAGRHGHAECLSGLDVDDQFELRRLLDGQISWLGALQNLAHVDRRRVIHFGGTCAVADQAANIGELTPFVERRNRMTCGECHEAISPAEQERIGTDQQCVGTPFDERRKDGVNITVFCANTLRSVVWADPPVIASAPPAPIVAVGAKKACADAVMAEMVTIEPMAAPYAAHASPLTAHPTDVTSPESEGANVSSAETATDMASAEATTAEAATTEAATTMTAAAPTTFHQHQQTAPCIQIGVIGIARLREGCRGRKSKRKSADDTKREDAAFHDCTSRGHLHDKFIAPPQAIGGHLRLQTDPPPSGFFLNGEAQPLVSQALWKPTCSR